MISKTVDGRRVNIYYFGNSTIEKEAFLQWYREMIINMEEDGLDASHIGLLSEATPGGYIRTRKRVEKRYLGIITDNYESVTGLDIMSIEPGTKELSSLYYLNAGIYARYKRGFKKDEFIGHLDIDFSIRDKINTEKYIETMRKYLPWNTEDMFETVPSYVPLNYLNLKRGTKSLKEAEKEGLKLIKISKRK